MMPIRKDHSRKWRSRLYLLLRLSFACLYMSNSCFGQAMYEMQNALVHDCHGVLTDSNNGPEDGQYDHLEDYTFTVCVPNATEIIIVFQFFSSEETYDVLNVYDGPDTNAPLLAMLTGSIQPPPVLVATSGCVTFHFTSDDNIVAAGWLLNWAVMIDDPVPPVLQLLSVLDCPMSSVEFQFDFPIDCDMMSASHFTLLGPGSPSIAQIVPLDCVSGGLGQHFQVIFSSPLVQPGTYRLLFNGAIQDACGDWHDLGANIVFDLSNCPFNVEIELEQDACVGDCGSVSAMIIGDAGVPYQYMWSITPINQAIIDVCSDVPVLISLTVTDPVSHQMATATYNYIPLPNPIILNPVADTVCSSIGDHIYQSNLPGGNWYSTIIPDNLQQEGRYQYWRWNQDVNLKQDIVTYVAPNGCKAYDTVYVFPVNAGSIQAACLNSNDFMVNGGTPVGGTWQGPNITAGGVFSPVQVGSFTVIYTAPNGCTASKKVNVQDVITMPDVDTLCSSQEFYLTADPYGGRWSGPGVVNNTVGTVRPWLVAPNQTYSYVYTLNGCKDTIDIYIQELWAGPDLAVCDADTLLMLTQTGNWTGPAPYLPADNAFDISNLGEGSYDFTLSAFGCSDAFRLYVINPYANLDEPLSFCLEDEWIPLNDYIDFAPDWGTFSGPSVVENNDIWYFNPVIAGAGVHTIVFDAVGCQDSFLITVEPFATIPVYSFCEKSTAQLLTANPPGGTWSGPGFLDGVSGLFDPQLLTPGSYPITYQAPSSCVTNDTIDIILWEQVSISGINQQYCFSDTSINVNISPPGGTFLIDSVPAMPMFNPAMLGAGNHELFYSRGTGPCGSTKRVFISITSPISGMPSPPDSICRGENAVVEVQASGGIGTLTSTWDQGLGFGSSHIVNPAFSTDYTVTVADGCSDPLTTMTSVFVHQPFDIEVEHGPAVCYDDTSYVEIIPPVPGQYSVYWQLDTIFESNYLEGQPGVYEAEVVELFSGCKQSYNISIPGPPPLSANFTVIPNQSCIDIIDNTVQVIDLTTGATGGWIDFGDGSAPIPYASGSFIEHDYTLVGDFRITFTVTNDLGCRDTFSRQVCVENKGLLYIPNVFSPNGDGNNDIFGIQAFGVGEISWTIFSRWGEKLFESHSLDAFWDGTFHGTVLDPGVFVVQVEYTDQVTGKRGEKMETLTLVR